MENPPSRRRKNVRNKSPESQKRNGNEIHRETRRRKRERQKMVVHSSTNAKTSRGEAFLILEEKHSFLSNLDFSCDNYSVYTWFIYNTLLVGFPRYKSWENTWKTEHRRRGGAISGKNAQRLHKFFRQLPTFWHPNYILTGTKWLLRKTHEISAELYRHGESRDCCEVIEVWKESMKARGKTEHLEWIVAFLVHEQYRNRVKIVLKYLFQILTGLHFGETQFRWILCALV